MVEFLVMGPLEVRGPVGAVALGGGKQRLLLALLVLHPGEAASRPPVVAALWPGPALAEIAEGPSVRAHAAALEERRLQVLETHAEAELALGRHVQLVSGLRAETSRDPERERPHELLMLALYRAGRQAEALEVYRATRTYLADELGLEPGPSLREIQARILR